MKINIGIIGLLDFKSGVEASKVTKYLAVFLDSNCNIIAEIILVITTRIPEMLGCFFKFE